MKVAQFVIYSANAETINQHNLMGNRSDKLGIMDHKATTMRRGLLCLPGRSRDGDKTGTNRVFCFSKAVAAIRGIYQFKFYNEALLFYI